MTCPFCGYASVSESAFCTNCGRRQAYAAAAGVAVGSGATWAAPRLEPQESALPGDTYFAPFVPRMIAFFIDSCAAGLLALAVYGVFAVVGGRLILGPSYGRGMGQVGAGAFMWFVGFIAAAASYGLYFVKQETSSRQATLGKSLFGLKVVRIDGRTVTAGQSFGRLFIKTLFSNLLFCLGYVMALFTERKQALHDFAAKTLVVRR